MSDKDINKYDPNTGTNRQLPPMMQMTRIQRRYFLEPWFTTIMVVGLALCLISEILGFWLPWHWQFIWTGVMFLGVGIGGGVAKAFHQELNVRTEGEMQTTSSRVRDDLYDY